MTTNLSPISADRTGRLIDILLVPTMIQLLVDHPEPVEDEPVRISFHRT